MTYEIKVYFGLSDSALPFLCYQITKNIFFRVLFICCSVSFVFQCFLSPSAVLKLRAVDRGVVVIQGTEAGRYLAMNDEGRLYSSVSIFAVDTKHHDHIDSKP